MKAHVRRYIKKSIYLTLCVMSLFFFACPSAHTASKVEGAIEGTPLPPAGQTTDVPLSAINIEAPHGDTVYDYLSEI